MKCCFKFRTCLLGALVAVVVLAVSGCATTNETDNLSSRPWNAPKGWEHGFPTMMNEGR
jgi:hypothetical protein